MARRLDLTSRDGKSSEMKLRSVRLTEDENHKLNYILEARSMTLRDFVAEQIEKEFIRIK